MSLPTEPQSWTLGLSADKALAALHNFTTKATRILEQRRGARESYRELLAKSIMKLRVSGAVPFDDAGRVERTMQAVSACAMASHDPPRVDMRTAVARAQELLEAHQQRSGRRAGARGRRSRSRSRGAGRDAPEHARRSKDKEPEAGGARGRGRSRRRAPSPRSPIPSRPAGSPSPNATPVPRRGRSRTPPTEIAEEGPPEPLDPPKEPPAQGAPAPTPTAVAPDHPIAAAGTTTAPGTPQRQNEQSAFLSQLAAVSPRTQSRMIEAAMGAARPACSAAAGPAAATPPPATSGAAGGLLTVEGGSNADVGGIVGGSYTMLSQNHGMPTYSKDVQTHDLDVLLYFWDERDGEQFCVLRFGHQLGGDHAWAHCPGRAPTPPQTGWRAPCDGPIDPTFVVTTQPQGPSLEAPPRAQPSYSAEAVSEGRSATTPASSPMASCDGPAGPGAAQPSQPHALAGPRQSRPLPTAGVPDLSTADHPTKRWDAHRALHPPDDPAAILVEQSSPNWQPMAANHVVEFSFAPGGSLDRDAQLWDFYRTLAYAGIYVHEVYAGAQWEARTNAWGGAGTIYVPAVRTSHGVTINWWQSRDGHLRCDGKTPLVEHLRPQLRRAFPAWTPGATAHGRTTGRQANRAMVQQGRPNQEDVQRGARQQRLAGKVRSDAADRQGAWPGVWDLLDEHIGVRNAIEDAERPLQTRAGATWQDEAEHARAEPAMEAADPGGAAPTEDREAATAHQRLGEELARAEAAAYTGALEGLPTLARPWSPDAHGRDVECWATGVAADVDRLLEEKPRTCSTPLIGLLPGPHGAAEALTAALHASATAAGQLAEGRRGQRSQGPSATLGSSAYAGPLRMVPHAADPAATQAASGWTLGGVSAGLSGGANLQGTGILTHRWRDKGTLMTALDVEFFLSTACRLLPGIDLSRHVPDFPFEAMGPATAKYGAVVGFRHHEARAPIEWLSGATDTDRIQWYVADGEVLIGGFAIPPKGPEAPEESRRELVDALFSQYDRIRRSRPELSLAVAYGDLNPSPSLEKHYRRHLTARGLGDLVPDTVATHVRGRRLDVAWTTDPVRVTAVVHNGEECRASGCTRQHCGKHVELFGCHDLDHYPVVLTGLQTRAPAGETSRSGRAARCAFSKEPGDWSVALRDLEPFQELAAEELRRWSQHGGTWRTAPDDAPLASAELASWLWRASCYLGAVTGGLLWVVRAPPLQLAPPSSAPLAADAIQATRRRQAERANSLARTRAARYIQLAEQDPTAAEQYLTKLSGQHGLGLPQIMEDSSVPGAFRRGDDVLAGAAQYIRQRGRGREADFTPRQKDHLRREERRSRDLLASLRQQWRQEWARDHRPYTEEDLRDACDRIKVGKASAGLPYACLKEMPQGQGGLLLCVQNFARFLMVIPGRWKDQPTFHKRKHGKPQQQYPSYRTLSTNTVELRVTEELWALHHEHALWLSAGDCQLGRGESLIAVLLGVETRLIRADLGLPIAEAFTDLAEAFDTIHAPAVILGISEGAGLTGEDLVLAAQMLHGSQVRVVSGEAQAAPVALTDGMPEGRRLAPAFFVAAARAFRAAAGPDCGGVGCRQGNQTWEAAMRAAPSHADQRALLDAASTLRVGLTQFMDDNVHRASSRGGLDLEICIQRITEAAQSVRGELRVGPGKTECISNGIADVRPIRGIAFATQHTSLGIPVEADARMIGLLRQVENRAQGGWASTPTAIEHLGLPTAAALAALRTRTTPRAFHGAALLIARGDWERRVDAIPDRWISRLLDLSQPVPRIALLREGGLAWRLSTSTLRRAFGLHARAQAPPQAAHPARVLRAARECQGTWTAALEHYASDLAAPLFAEWARGALAQDTRALSGPARRRATRRYLREAVDPGLQAREDEWLAGQRALYPARGVRSLPEVSDLALVCHAVRPWAQLRLQGRFTSHGGMAAPCRWRGAVAPVDGSHLGECPQAARAARDAAAGTPWEGDSAAELWRRCREDADVLTAITVAGRLAA
ncbi:unnamed protein product, partial [Prorocentrum cordatum]